MVVTQSVRSRSRASRSGLSPESVLRAAIAVADAEGIDAVTMRRLAEELDVHPTSIYNHLPSKEAILDGMIDLLLVEADLPLTVREWPDWVRGFGRAMCRIAREHPGAFAVFLRRPATGPIASRHTEGALDAFRRAGFSAKQANRAVHGASLALFGLATNEGPLPIAGVEPDRTFLTREAFPRLFEAEAAADTTTDPTWDLLIDALISGLATTMQSTGRRPARGRTAQAAGG